MIIYGILWIGASEGVTRSAPASTVVQAIVTMPQADRSS